ncbi:MAG: glycosyltransferase, partial [Candidatus Levybacteria bacterium]|nr:glycosyltransferase [Candidatus Levybacteria bacterium]
MGKKRSVKSKFKSVVIATFSAWKNGQRAPTNGMIEPLLSYFGDKTDEIILIDSPHPGSSDDIIPKIQTLKNNKLVKQTKPLLIPPLFILNKFNTAIKTQPAFKIRDFTTVFQVLLSKKTKTDLFIGLESINTIVGIIFKKLGKVKTVIYYVSDYSPNRYSSKLFNNIYLFLDRFCAKNADYIWDVSPAMMPARIKNGLSKNDAKPCIHVPNALFPHQIRHLTIGKLEPYSLAFAGTIGPENGLDLAIEALAIAKKQIPELKLYILGGGVKEEEKKVDILITKLKLEKSVKNFGFISDLNLLSDILTKYMVGLAPYKYIESSVRLYADATKIRLYFANGLPVITTDIPPLAKEVKQKGCGIVVKDKKEELAKAIVEMLSDKNKYLKYRDAAIKFAQNNTWENTYS